MIIVEPMDEVLKDVIQNYIDKSTVHEHSIHWLTRYIC